MVKLRLKILIFWFLLLLSVIMSHACRHMVMNKPIGYLFDLITLKLAFPIKITTVSN